MKKGRKRFLRKVLGIVTATAVVFTSVPIVSLTVEKIMGWDIAYAEDVNETEKLDYEYSVLEDGTIEITRYTGNSANIVVPEMIKGKKVSRIGHSAFYRCYGLSEVKIPSTVISIGDWAFSECYGLGKIEILSNVTNIGEFAFSDCKSLSEVKIPNSVTSIGDFAFSGCSSLSEIEIPSSVTSIGERVFVACSNLSEVKIPNSVISIGQLAFGGCSSLSGVKIPNSVTYIGDFAFLGCSSLGEVEIPSSVTNIRSEAFSGCSNLSKINVSENNLIYSSVLGVLFNKNKTELIRFPNGKYGKYEIPSSVTSIRDYAFSDCSSLSEVKIPSSVTSIGSGAFSGCSSLGEVEIPSSMTSIGERAFSGCSNLSGVKIPSSVTNIRSGAFSGCSSLSEIEISSSVTYIGSGAFSGCSSLSKINVSKNNLEYSSVLGVLFNKDKTELIRFPNRKNGKYEIPNSVTSIGIGAFSGCSSLSEIEIPSNVTSIGNRAFSDCSSLSEIEIPSSVTSIETSAFSGCSSLSEIEIPSNVTNIGSFVFAGCSSLRKINVSEDNLKYSSVLGILFNKDKTELISFPCKKDGKYKIPSSVTKIEDGAFSGCSKLTEVKIPSSVTNIGYSAFWRCSNLTNIEIPFGVVKIEDGTFSGCSKLSEVKIPNSVTSIEHFAFEGCNSLGVIEIPSSVASIEENAFDTFEGLIIKGLKNSYAEVYAKAQNISFVYINTFSSNNGISVSYESEGEESNLILQSNLLKKGDDAYQKINLLHRIVDKNISPEDVIFQAYDITLTNELQFPVQPENMVTVKIPVPEGYRSENCKIYHVEENGNLTNMNAEYFENHLTFQTDHFSIYLITETELREQGSVIYGDINGDGEVNTKDAVLLKKYLAGYEALTFDRVAADVNGDGEVNSKDAVRLLRHLAGYQVILGE